ncbi:MAG: hypothetical protein MHM6MM_004300 [Cercozoa sp. M6MM]
MVPLDKGAIPLIVLQNRSHVTGYKPALQVLKIAQSKAGYKAIVTDGYWFCQCALHEAPEDLTENSIVRAEEYQTNVTRNGAVVIVLQRVSKLALGKADVSPDSLQKFGNWLKTNERYQSINQKMLQHIRNHTLQPGKRPDDVADISSEIAAIAGGGSPMVNSPTPAFGSPVHAQAGHGGMQSVPEGHSQPRPISQLNAFQKNFTIRGICTNVGDLKEWNKGDRSGQLKNVEIKDESGVDVRIVGFNEVAQMMENTFQLGKTYWVSNGRLKPKNPRWNSTKCRYEISLFDNSVVTLDQTSAVPAVSLYDFKKIEEFASPDTPLEEGLAVDVVAIVRETGDLVEGTSRAGRPYTRRRVRLRDETGEVEATLWNEAARKFPDNAVGKVAVCRRARIGEYQGSRQVSLGAVDVSPSDVKEATRLQHWYDSEGGSSTEVRQFSAPGGDGGASREGELKHIADIYEENLGMSDNAEYVTTMCTLTDTWHRDKPPFYEACQGNDCSKRVMQDDDGGYVCNACGHRSADCDVRYIARFRVRDGTGDISATCFDRVAPSLFNNMPAKQLWHLYKQGDDRAYRKVLQRARFQTAVMTLRMSRDTYQGTERRRAVVIAARPVNYGTEGHKLLASLQQQLSN